VGWLGLARSWIRYPLLANAVQRLLMEEIIAYWNIMHKIDPRWVRHAFDEAFIDRGLTNSEVLRLLERAKERAKWKQ
jgi:hypothetical protein